MTPSPQTYATESFNFSHKAIRPQQIPFVRFCKEIPLTAPNGTHQIQKLDVRCVMPNAGSYLTPAIAHTVEHIVADYINANAPHALGIKSVDFSPMGCQTGFYWTILLECKADGSLPQVTPEQLCSFLNTAFGQLETATQVPAAFEDACGNYRSHDLDGAKELARQLVSRGFTPYAANQ